MIKRHYNLPPFRGTFHYNCFLKHIIFGKRIFPGIEKVDKIYLYMLKQEITEQTEISSRSETSWGYINHLTLFRKQ